MRFDVITLFPGMFPGPLGDGIVGRALDRNLLRLRVVNVRDFADPPHRQVDDEPFGGGAGMVLKPEPLFCYVEAVRDDLDAAG
ncbi:MAG: tRNA (guanosine(37)-N1)-methyltransferase TrmD, partial [Acidobacteriota bacterium]